MLNDTWKGFTVAHTLPIKDSLDEVILRILHFAWSKLWSEIVTESSINLPSVDNKVNWIIITAWKLKDKGFEDMVERN